MASLKDEFLELLDKDRNFRYTVAGYLGLSEILKSLEKVAQEQVRLREDFNKMLGQLEAIRIEVVTLRGDVGTMNVRLGRVERTLEKLTVEIEDEARSIVGQRLREAGVHVKLSPLILPDLEVDIYGVADDMCVVGETSVRTGRGLAEELSRKIEKLKRGYSDRLRKRIIPVLYVSQPMPELVAKARELSMWLLKATQDYTKPRLQS